jgi:acetolactate synthase I/II/III large subunit
VNGAETVLKAAVDAGIDTCFANPGTTEMPFVAAMDSTPGLRSVLCLFEGVCTGAADGYARMTGAPAMTLMHLGPGFANGIANLHNARRAHSPVVNLIGEHPTWHQAADPPLNSDIDALTSAACTRSDRLEAAGELGERFADLLEFARQPFAGPVAAIIPHDVQLATIADRAYGPRTVELAEEVSVDSVEEAAQGVRGGHAVLILGGDALSEKGLDAAARIAASTDVAIFGGGFPARAERGGGRFAPRRLPYFPEHAAAALGAFKTIVLVGEPVPVSFFGWPGHPSRLVRDDQRVIELAGPTDRAGLALEALADELGGPSSPRAEAKPAPLIPPTGAITAKSLAEAIAYVQPADAIVVDEGATSTGELYFRRSACSRPHTYLTLTGGAIGFGMPCATGAAIAGGGRRVLSIQADGSAMYTVQALWTQAREGCDVTTVICDNAAYRILGIELDRAGVVAGAKAAGMVTLVPALDWVALARGMSVPAIAVDDVESLMTAVTRANGEPGPQLIQARMTG